MTRTAYDSGYFIGDRFVHLEFAFELTVPKSWTVANERSYVAALSPAEDAAVILRVAEGATDPGRALRAFLSQDGVSGDAVHSEEGDGLSISRADFATDSDDGQPIRGEAAFIQLDGRVYQVLAFADRLSWGQYSGVAGASVFHDRYPGPVSVADLAGLNRTTPDVVLPGGYPRQARGRHSPPRPIRMN